MEAESGKFKICYAIVSFIWVICMFSLGGCLAHAAHNAVLINNICDEGSNTAQMSICDDSDGNYFDTYYLRELSYVDDEDIKKAQELLTDIANDYDIDEQRKGSRFTVCYTFGAVTLLTIGFANFC